MFAAGYSAKMTEEDQQGVSAFEYFAEGDLFTFNGLEGEVGGGFIEFEGHGIFILKVIARHALPRSGVELW